MSFRTTDEVLVTFQDCFSDAHHWCVSLRQLTSEPKLMAALALLEVELETSAKRFQAAHESEDAKTLKTFLQYEPEEELTLATHMFTRSEPQNADELIEDVSNFYHKVFDGLTECETTASSTASAQLFQELFKETHAGISSLAWNIRPPV